MPPKQQPKARRLYWDASVFVSYVNGEADRVPTIEAILAENEEGTTEIFTSQLTMVEVIYAKSGERKQVDEETEKRIITLIKSARMIDVHELISTNARGIIRNALSNEIDPNAWRVKSNDAIHLATAKFLVEVVGLDEVHTYDLRWDRYTAEVGCKITRPTAETFSWPRDAASAPAQP